MLVLIYTTERIHTANWLPKFIEYLSNDGHQLIIRHKPVTRLWLNTVIPFVDHIFMWNGEQAVHSEIKKVANKFGVGYSVIEVGFFPQKSHIVFDRKGINANSELLDHPLDWVSEKHLNKLKEFKTRYLGSRKYNGNDKYVLCPLQLEHDTNILLHSPFKTMQSFINHAESRYSEDQIVFKQHPLDENNELKCSPRNTIVKDGDILDLAQDAKLVYGINSTSLLETSLMGTPTLAVGEGYLKNYQKENQKLLAALLDKQANIDNQDYSYWLENYTQFPSHSKILPRVRYLLSWIFAKSSQVLYQQIKKSKWINRLSLLKPLDQNL